MLTPMDQAAPEARQVVSEAPPIASEPRPSAVASASTQGDRTFQEAPLRGCPFLVAEEGGWRLDAPSRAHRCGAVSPPAPLSPEKQARLCLTAAHTGCATLQASLSARRARLGPATENDRATRWGLARTTTVIEEAGGLRARAAGLLLDRGRWPAIPAVILVLTLLVLAASGLRPTSPAAVESSATPGASATHAPASTPGPTLSSSPEATSTPATTPTAQPTARPTGLPAPSAAFTTYKVKSGDTLSGIASSFGVTVREILDLNGISIDSKLRVGQVLKIPTA
jgi:LysM repeat protein